ncbi:hypothetical protein BDF21DRAFT_407777 [Thamnidium elegans]|nr:hypothetical protein BDF21DRAFT_407777 [Thamnidium elegans]
MNTSPTLLTIKVYLLLLLRLRGYSCLIDTFPETLLAFHSMKEIFVLNLKKKCDLGAQDHFFSSGKTPLITSLQSVLKEQHITIWSYAIMPSFRKNCILLCKHKRKQKCRKKNNTYSSFYIYIYSLS